MSKSSSVPYRDKKSYSDKNTFIQQRHSPKRRESTFLPLTSTSPQCRTRRSRTAFRSDRHGITDRSHRTGNSNRTLSTPGFPHALHSSSGPALPGGSA